MALPVTIPNTFANATSSIPLSQLDTNFSTLANAVNGLNSGSETLANLKATTANVGVLTVTGNATIGDASTDTVTLNSTLTANTAVIFAAGTSAAPSITTTGDTNTGIFFPAADTIAFAEGGAEAMRINSSGNVGIGTDSPSNVLEVTKNQNATTRISVTNSDSTTTSSRAAFRATSAAVDVDITAITGLGGYIGTSTNNPLNLITNGSDRLTIDTSGNVGIGVTPSAWGTNKALQVERGGVTSYLSVQTDLFQNCYYDGSNWKYIATDEANKLSMFNGQFIMYSAPSGTAGNNITFTEVFQVNKDKTIALQGATQQTGTGITFPATQSASSDANTLDDYEEGTFTPTLAGGFSSGPTSYTTQLGRYTKIGRFVYIEVFIDAIGATANASRVIFGGLPFTAAGGATTTNGGGFIVYQALFNTNAGDALVVQPSNTTIDFYTNAGASRNGNDAGVNINEQIRFNAVYVV